MEQAGETVRHFASQGELGLVLGTLIVIVIIFASLQIYSAKIYGSRIDALTVAIRAEIDRAHEATVTDRAEHTKAHAMILSEIVELRKDSERRDETLIELVRLLVGERRPTSRDGMPRTAELAASAG